MELISLLVWKLWAFPQGSNFVNFQQFFHHNFWLKWNFWILMVSLERSSSDLSEYTLLYIKKIFLHLKKLIFRCKMRFFRFFYAVFFILLPKFADLMNSDNCIGKITLKSIRIYPVFIQTFFSLVKKGIISDKT